MATFISPRLRVLDRNERRRRNVRPIDRRTFLALGLGAVAWSCARGKGQNSGRNAISIVATAQMGLARGDTRNGLAGGRGQCPVIPKGPKSPAAPSRQQA